MNISPINNSKYSNAYISNQSFKSSNRVYIPAKMENYARDKIKTATCFFRDGLDWQKIPELLMNNFKDKSKVNFYCFACSDGSEPLSYAMLMLDKIPKEIRNKYLPIMASDIDEESISAAKSGFINITDEDILARITRNTSLSVNDMFKYYGDKLKLTEDTFARVPEYSHITYKTQGELANSVNFEQSDLIEALKKINDDGNTVISCRNVMFYFSKDYIQRFFETLGNTLKPNSLFIIGQNEIMAYADKYLEKLGFTEIAQNVYRKN